MWSTAVKILLLVSAVTAGPLLYSLDQPQTPSEPGVKDPQVQEPHTPDPEVASTATNPSPQAVIHRFSLKLTLQGGKTRLLQWEAPGPVLYLTNQAGQTLSIQTLDYASVQHITISQWQPLPEGNARYRFEPVQAVLVLKDGRMFTAPALPGMHEISGLSQGETIRLWTVFYDQWMSGEKNIYRWKNSRAGSFNYNFTHPLQGVVIRIDFLEPDLKPREE